MTFCTFGDIEGLEVTDLDIERYESLCRVHRLLQMTANYIIH